MTAPTKINSGNGRTVSRTDVLKADDPAVEREQLNRILKSLDSRLYLAEQAIDDIPASSTSSEGSGLSNLSVDTGQLDYLPIGGGAYYLNIAAGGVGTLELADEAVTTAKIDDEAVTTAKIDDDAVTFAKMQNIATDRLIGRDTASSGSPEEISVGGGLEFTGSAGIQRSALTGDITASAGSNATTLATVNANVGSFGAANETLSLTLDGKGRVTAASSQAIAIAYTQVSGLGNVVTYNTGTSGGTVPLCNTAITWGGVQVISAAGDTLTLSSVAPRLILAETDGSANAYINLNNGLLFFGTSASTANRFLDVTLSTGALTINDVGADADTRIEGDTLPYMFFTDASAATENIALLTGSAPNWQSMDRGVFIGDASAVPTGNPTSGGFLYVEAGALKWRGSSGTITTLGAA